VQPPIVILVRTTHPGNAGAAARSAANFGCRELRFVAPLCDVKGKEAADRAVHAGELLKAARVYPDMKSALGGVSLSVGTTARTSQAENRFQRKPEDIRDFVASIRDWNGQVAYVFGNEQDGLSNDEIDLLDQLITIPTSDYWSMNLSHAVAIVCYDHYRASAASVRPKRELSPDALNALNTAWDDLVAATEKRMWRKRTARTVWRKMIGRTLPDTYEVHNVMGILANALKRFGHPDYATDKSEAVLERHGLKAEPASMSGDAADDGDEDEAAGDAAGEAKDERPGA
jgi:tRNA/rRNA methyltransferase